MASGGINEVKRHVEHKELVAGMAGQSTLASAISRSSVTDQVTIAEVYFSMFVAEHNLSFLAADHFSKLCKVMFPDSKIASEYSSGRTKTTCIIVKHALAPSCLEFTSVERCCSSPCTILCDGGNDQYIQLLTRIPCALVCFLS